MEGHKDTLGSGRDVCYFDYGDGFLGVYRCQNQSNCITSNMRSLLSFNDTPIKLYKREGLPSLSPPLPCGSLQGV